MFKLGLKQGFNFMSKKKHTATVFDHDLDALSAKIKEMCGIAENMLVDAIDAISRHDVDLARLTIAADARLDELQREVEESAVLLIVRRQPVSIDLREVVTAMRICRELERVGDLAKNVAKRVLKLAKVAPIPSAVISIRDFAELAIIQLRWVIDAYTRRDEERAEVVWLQNIDIDAKQMFVFEELLALMTENSRNITLCSHLIFTSKNIEQVVHHTTNIAEEIYFLVTGEKFPLVPHRADPAEEL